MRDLVKSMMRQRPDRIVVGEVRDGAALDLLKAWNTHAGGFGTVHASNAVGALHRIAMLLQEVVTSVPYAFIAETVDVVIQLQYKNNRRKVSEIIELKSYNVAKQQFEYASVCT
jgi:type IV secretion system protein VirB11